jgi:hypothetical protein
MEDIGFVDEADDERCGDRSGGNHLAPNDCHCQECECDAPQLSRGDAAQLHGRLWYASCHTRYTQMMPKLKFHYGKKSYPILHVDSIKGTLTYIMTLNVTRITYQMF